MKTVRQQRYPKIVKPDWDYSKREWVEQGGSKKNFHYMQGVLLTHDFRLRLEKPTKMKINR